MLACGHEPSSHSDFTTGTGWFNGVEICARCSENLEDFYFHQSDAYSLYLNTDKRTVTTWTGRILGEVIRQWDRKNAWSKVLVHVIVKDLVGQKWYGDGSGGGMVIHLHRSKPRKVKSFRDHAEEIESLRCDECDKLKDSTRMVLLGGHYCADCRSLDESERKEIKAQEKLDEIRGK